MLNMNVTKVESPEQKKGSKKPEGFFEKIEFTFSVLTQLRDRNQILHRIQGCMNGEFEVACVVLDRSAKDLHFLYGEHDLETTCKLPFDRINGVFSALLWNGQPALVRHTTGDTFYYFPIRISGSPLGLIQISRKDHENEKIRGAVFQHVTSIVGSFQEPLIRLYQGLRYTVSVNNCKL